MKKAVAKSKAGIVSPKNPANSNAVSKNMPRKNGPKNRPANAPSAAGSIVDATVLDRLYGVIIARRMIDPAQSHSARLLSRGTAKVAQKFGEEAVECLIEAVAGNAAALVAESADVLYHLAVMWVASGVTPEQVWTELHRREGISGIIEKAARAKPAAKTSKIP